MNKAEYNEQQSRRKAMDAEFNQIDRHITQPIDDDEPRFIELPDQVFVYINDDKRFATH